MNLTRSRSAEAGRIRTFAMTPEAFALGNRLSLLAHSQEGKLVLHTKDFESVEAMDLTEAIKLEPWLESHQEELKVSGNATFVLIGNTGQICECLVVKQPRSAMPKVTVIEPKAQLAEVGAE